MDDMRESEPRLEEILSSHPDWERMNAFERTKLCCAEMTRRGERLPSWSVIRDIIGKGSAGDINRGKESFRREHAEALRRLGKAVDGVPEELQAAFVEIWRVAVATARDSLSADLMAVREQLLNAEHRARVAEEDSLRAQALAAEAEARARDAEERNARDARRMEALHEALARADQETERMLAARSADRDAFAGELARQQEQLKSALERLEGAEAFALHRIEEARGEAAARVAQELREARDRAAAFEARLRQAEALHEQAVATISELRKELAARRKEGEAMMDLLGSKKRLPYRRWRSR